LKRFLKWAVVCVLLAVLLPAIFVWNSLPNKQMISDAEAGLQIVFEKKGDQLFEQAVFHNLRVPESKMSNHLKNAFIAIEDRRFQWHPGFDPVGIFVALSRSVFQGKRLRGGSTITQQLAKNLFFSGKRKILRKIKEVVLALKLEFFFSKQTILEMYLNNVYFGGEIYGVETASRKFFLKRSRDLNVFEAAILAGAVKAPNSYHIKKHPKKAKKRARLVLKQMVKSGFISVGEKNRAEKTGIQVGNRKWRDIEHGYFRDWILPEVKRRIGEHPGPFRVFTTLNTESQTYAELSIKEAIRKNSFRKKVSQGALVAMTNEGAVQAMVGGVNFKKSQFNRSTQAVRQPSSTIKPFIFLSALEAGYQPDRRVYDRPINIDGWSPTNYDHKYLGPIRMDEALALSRNTVAASLLNDVGRDPFRRRLRELGLKREMPDDPSLALGTEGMTPIELLALYATLSNGKRVVPPFGLYGISDKYGNVLHWRSSDTKPSQPLIAQSSHVSILNMLRKVVLFGTGRAALFGKTSVWGKTGTSQDYRDAWFAGFTNNLVGKGVEAISKYRINTMTKA
jgi:penicillin-binding protein 1A